MSTINSLVDETTNIKNELVDNYANLKNNLIEKGIEILPVDKFPELIKKVAKINTGKKWASGTIIFIQNSQKYRVWGENTQLSMPYIEISNLSFTPSYIIAYGKSANYDTNYQLIGCLYFNYKYKNTFLTFNANTINVSYNNSGYSYALTNDENYFNKHSIKIPFSASEYDRFNSSNPINWIAFE